MYRLSPIERDNRERLQKAQSNSKATSKSKALNYLKCIVSLPWREIRERGYRKPIQTPKPQANRKLILPQMHRLSPVERDKRER
jgi:hypothetical protein